MLILTTPELHNQTIFNTEPVQLQGLEILHVPFSNSLNAPSGTEQTFLLGLIMLRLIRGSNVEPKCGNNSS